MTKIAAALLSVFVLLNTGSTVYAEECETNNGCGASDQTPTVGRCLKNDKGSHVAFRLEDGTWIYCSDTNKRDCECFEFDSSSLRQSDHYQDPGLEILE